MKKRLSLILLVVALLVAAAVFTVQADEETTTHTYLDLTTFNCPCSKCGGKPYTGTWKTTFPTSLADGDHVYLKDNTATPGGQINYINDGEFVMVLDNYTVNTTAVSRALRVSVGTLHLIGNNAVWEGTFANGSTTGSFAQLDGGGKLQLYGTETGTMTIRKRADSTSVNTQGGLFRITGSGSTLTVNTGAILEGCYVSSKGGVAHIEAGKVVINGGTVNGSATKVSQAGAFSIAGGTLEVKAGTIQGGKATKGGNIYITSGTLKLTGGTITGGVSDQGGNIFQSGGTLDLQKGAITGGQAGFAGNINSWNGTIKITGTEAIEISGGTATSSYGGNIYCHKGSDANATYLSKLTINNPNAVISGGTAKTEGGNIRALGEVTLQQGTIQGGNANSGADIFMNGTFVMEGGAVNGGTATSGGAIYVAGGTATLKGGVINGGTAEAGGAVYLYGGTLSVEGATINGSAADKNVSSGGAVMAYNGTFTMSSGTIQGGNAVNGGNLYLTGVTLTMTGGEIKDGVATEMGGNAYMFYRSKNGDIAAASTYLKVNGGTIKDGTVNVAEGTEDIGYYGGGNVYISRACYLVVNGGTVSGGTVTGGNGGNIFSRGKTTLTSGAITGGTAPNGGTIYAYCQTQETNKAIHANYARVVVEGGTLTGGTATTYGGAIYIGAYGSADFTGGTITGGTANRGGNIYIAANTEVKISGATTVIENGGTRATSTNNGGANIYMAGGSVTMSGGTIQNGNASADSGTQATRGGNLRMAGGTFTMTDGSILGGSAGNLGGSISVASGTLKIQGGKVEGGKATISNASGGVIGQVGGTIQISGGTVSGWNGEGTQTKNATGGGLFYIYSGTTTISGSAVLEKGYATNGGLINVAGGTLNVTGGTLQNGKASSRGGNIYRGSGTLTISGGTISGGNAEDGGNVYTAAATISGGTIQSGAATDCGGNIFHLGGTLTISGGTITEGSAKTGGNIYSYDGTLNIVEAAEKTVIISDGEVTGAGGNLYAGSSNETSGSTTTAKKSVVTITLTNGKISGGTANSGASIYSTSEVTFTSGTIEGGVSKNNGGTIYVANGTHGDTFTMTGGTINGGQSTAYQGGTAFVEGGAKMNISGGTINVATTGNGCKGIRVVGGAVTLSGDAVINYNGLRIGDAVDVVNASASGSASLTLSGNASIYNVGTDDATGIHIQNYDKHHAKLIVKDDWTGSAEFFMEYYGTSSNKEATLTYGDTIVAEVGVVADASDDGIGAFTGKLTYAGLSGNPQVLGNGAALVVAKTAIRTADAYQWFIDNAAAVAAYAAVTDPAYIRFYTNDTVDLTGLEEVYIDLYGHSVAATGNEATVYVIDTTTSTTAASKGTLTGVGAETYAHNPLSGYRYIALGDAENGYKAHALEIAVSGVSVRPSSAGIYYNATIKCDDDLKALLDTYGVAVSVATMPNDQFWLAGSQALYTALDKEKFESGKSFTGVIINNIMKEGNATNGARAEMPIYANAYVSFEIDGDPFIIMADETYQGLDITDPGFGGIAKSLKGLMPEIDRIYFSLDEATQRTGLRAMYEKYSDVMSGWGLTNIPAAVNGTTTVNKGTLKVLTIGNSLSVDANRMLAAVAQAEGMEGMTVGTLYYSGCTLAQHVKFLSTAEKEYVYYESGFGADFEANKTVGTGIVPTTKSAYTMEMGLEAQDWDIIVMQQGVTTAAQASTYNSNIQTIIDVVKEYCPEAKLYWNNVWASPMDEACRATANNGIAPDYAGSDAALKEALGYAEDQALDAAAQMKMFNMINNAVKSKIVTNPNFVRVIPSGTAVQNANTTFLTDVELYRDYVHGSSYTRLMTAYVWYCVLTGQDQITELKMDTIPTTLFSGSKEVINPPTEDVVLEEVYQNIIIDAVNGALNNPFGLTDLSEKYPEA